MTPPLPAYNGDSTNSKGQTMSTSRGHCIDCGTEMNLLDDDPNGNQNATCARCRAESEHDFDAEPNVVFTRTGEPVDARLSPRQMPENLRSVFHSIPQQPQRQDSTREQLADLHAFANRLGLYDAADAIKGMAGR